MRFVTSLIFLLSLSTSVAFAQSLTLGQPGYGGTGCPGGSAAVTLSPDSKSLSIIFDQFVVEAGGTTGKTIDRKSCDIAIPVEVPNGVSVSIMSIDYRGFNALPKGAYSRFTSEYFFAGTQGPKYSKTFYGKLQDEYFLNNKLVLTATSWSQCGEDVTLRVNSGMMISNSSSVESGMATVDSADFNAGVIFHLQFKPCLR